MYTTTQFNRVLAKIVLSIGYIAEKYQSTPFFFGMKQEYCKPLKKRCKGINPNDVLPSEDEQAAILHLAKTLIRERYCVHNGEYFSKNVGQRANFLRIESMLPGLHWKSLISENKSSRLSANSLARMRAMNQQESVVHQEEEVDPLVNVSP